MNEIVFNKGMKVFSKLFVGIKNTEGDKIPLAFATPYEENAAGKKRQDTVMAWLGSEFEYVVEYGQYVKDENGHNKRIERKRITKILDNTPRSGFKITDEIKRTYWGGGNVVWRIFDPYGFELEIQSNNLMALIQTCGIEGGGLIPGNCVWGRDAGVNILLHESSEEYKNAIQAAETLKPNKKIPMKDRIIGGMYTLQTGEQGIYLGKYWVYTENQNLHYNNNISSKDGKIFCSAISTFKIDEPEQYEAVLFDVDIKYRTSRIVFYKNASLIRYDNITYDLNVDVDLENSIKSFPVKYAHIVYMSRDKIDLVKYSTKPISKKDFDQSLKHSINVFGGPGTIYSANDLYFFDSKVFLKQSDGLFGGSSRSYYLNQSNSNLLGPVDLNDDTYSVVMPQRLESSYSSCRKDIRQIEAIPVFTSKEAMIEWCTEQFNAGNIVKITVEPA